MNLWRHIFYIMYIYVGAPNIKLHFKSVTVKTVKLTQKTYFYYFSQTFLTLPHPVYSRWGERPREDNPLNKKATIHSQ